MDKIICKNDIIIWGSDAVFKIPHVPDIAGRNRIDERITRAAESITAALLCDYTRGIAGRGSMYTVSGFLAVW